MKLFSPPDVEISLKRRCFPSCRKKGPWVQGSCGFTLQVWSGIGCTGLVVSWALQHSAESTGTLEVVLRLSHFAEVEMETKHQATHDALRGLWGGVLKKIDLGYLHLKCQGA